MIEAPILISAWLLVIGIEQSYGRQQVAVPLIYSEAECHRIAKTVWPGRTYRCVDYRAGGQRP